MPLLTKEQLERLRSAPRQEEQPEQRSGAFNSEQLQRLRRLSGQEPETGGFEGAFDGLGSQIAEAPGIIGRGLGQAVLDEVGREVTAADVADSARSILPGEGTGVGKYSAGVGISRTARDAVGAVRSAILPDSVKAGARELADDLRASDVEARSRVEESMPDDLGIIAQGLRSGAQSLTEMAPGTILSAVTRNPAYMLANISGTSGGRAYGDARAEGMDVKDAQDFAAIQTGIELMTEYLPAKTFTEIFGEAGRDWKSRAFKFLREEMVGEQAATLLQSANEVAYGLDEELERALDAGDAGAVSKIVAERAAITAVATAAAGGGQVAIGKAADYAIGGSDPNREVARELNRQLEDGGDVDAAAGAFREDRVRQSDAEARERRDAETRRQAILSELRSREASTPRALPNPNPAGADFQVDGEGGALATGGESRAQSEQALLLEQIRQNRIRTGAEEAVREAGERAGRAPRRLTSPTDIVVDDEGNATRASDPTGLPNPNRAEADFLTGEEGTVRSNRIDDLRRTRDARDRLRGRVVDDEPPARTIGRQDPPPPAPPTAPRALPNPNRSGADFIVGEEGAVRGNRTDDLRRTRDARARLQGQAASAPRDEAPAPRRITTPERMEELRSRGQAPVVESTPPVPVAKPRIIKTRKAQEIYGVDKGGTVVPTETVEAFVWKDDGNGFWNISFPKESGLPDVYSRPDTRAELIEQIQTDLPGLLETSRTPTGERVATPEQVAQARGEVVEEAPAAQVEEDILDEDPTIDEEVVPEERVPTGRPVRDVEARAEEARARAESRETEADVSIVIGRKIADDLSSKSQTIENSIVDDGSGLVRLEMSVEDAELAIAELEDVGGGRWVMSAIQSLDRAINDFSLAQFGGRDSPLDRPPGSAPVLQKAQDAADWFAEEARYTPVDSDVTWALEQFDAEVVEEVSARDLEALGQALADLESQGMNLDALRKTRPFFYDGGDNTGVYIYESRALGIDVALLMGASRGVLDSQAALRSILAHELGHAADYSVGRGRGVSMRHRDMALQLSEDGMPSGMGPAMQEAYDAFAGDGQLSEFLEYPFGDVPGMVEDGVPTSEIVSFIQTEVFAQGHALYYTDRELLRSRMPRLFAIVEETTNAYGLSNEAGRSPAPGSGPVSGDVREADPADGQQGGVDEARGDGREDQPGDRGRRAAARADAPEQEGELLSDQPEASFAKAGREFGLDPQYLTGTRGNVDPKQKVIDGANPRNIDQVTAALDRVAENHPDPLASDTAWLRMEREVTGSNVVPRPPYTAIRYAQDMDAWADNMLRMTPDQIAGAARGFEGLARMKRVYDDGIAQPDTTARVLLWGMLSRRASAYPHEAGYLDLSKGGELDQFIETALTRELTDQDIERWLEFVQRTMPDGSPGRSIISNANDFGRKLLRKMSVRTDGKSGIERFHEMISDPSFTTAEVRRQFYALAPNSGIRNKVISFAMLMTGRTDAMIMDRIQINTFMDWSRYGKLIYDDVASVYDGAQGLARYEALERSIGARIPELYERIGRPGDASIGRFHWESWVLNSGQVVAHPTFAAIERQALGQESVSDIVAPEGRYTKFAYGSAYGRGDDGNPFFLYPTTEGEAHRFSVDDFRAMLAEVKNPARGVIPRGFRLDDYSGKGFPWFMAPEVNQERLNELVRQYGTREEQAGGAGAPQADAQRAAADGAGQPRASAKRRSRSDARSAGSDRRGDQGRVPRYGRGSVEGAVQVRARHYSREARSSLSSSFFGQGLQGEERRRLAGAPEELRNRVYFYVDDGAGIRPESGVGTVAHEVELTNIYDARTREIRLTDPNEFELEVIRRGFDGYMTRFPGNQRAVVLLGPQHTDVPVQEVPADAETTPAAAAPASIPDVQEIPIGADMRAVRNALEEIQRADPEAKIQWGNLRVSTDQAPQVNEALEAAGASIRAEVRPRASASRPGNRTKANSYREALRTGGLMTQPGPASGKFNLDDETRTLGWVGKLLSGDWWRRKLQDKMIRLKRTQDRMSEILGIDGLPDALNPYRKEELFHGKVADDLEQLEEKHIQKLADIMAEEGISHGELDVYLYAKHAIERNAWIVANRDPNNPAGSGMTDAEARDILQRISNEGKTRAYEKAGKVVWGMLEENRQRMEREGLTEPNTVDEWRQRFQFYVPLQGFAEVDIEAIPRSGKGFSVGGKEGKSAAGRTTLADSPLAHAVSLVTEKILRARKNEVAVSFLEMAETYPDETMWKVYDPAKKGMLPTENIVIDGKTVERPVNPETAMRVDGTGLRFYAAKRGGRTFYVEIKDELLNRAMHNAGVEQIDGTARLLVNTAGRATRFLSSMNTTLNPEFFIVNAARDVQAALFNMLAEQQIPGGKAKGKTIAKQMLRDAIPSYRAFARGLRGEQGKSREDQELDRYYRDFREDGAMTGWAQQMTVEEQRDRIERLARIAGGGPVAATEKGARGLLKWIEDRNLEFENAIRLSAYTNARREGVSRDQAASLAKNLTVNFNRRGEASTVANSLFMFFNAAVQGNAQILRSLANDPRKIGGLTMAQKAAAGMVGSGVALTIYNMAASAIDDDDESFYEKIPDYVKERNFVIMLPDGKDYVKIPLPYGYNIFHVAGVGMAEAFEGQRSAVNAALLMGHSVFDSFSPLGLSTSDDLGASIGKAITPSVALPFVELALNENHFGSPIYRENFPTGTQLPDSTLSMRNTAGWLKDLTQFLNSATGGERNVDGAIDVSPDALEHLVEYATGGLGRFTLRTVNLEEALRTGDTDDLEARDVPFLRQVYGEPSRWENMGRYYDRRYDVEQVLAEFDERRGKEKVEWLEEHRDLIGLKGVIESTESQLRTIRKQRRNLESLPPSSRTQEGIDRLVEAEFKQYDRFNRAYNRATGGE